MLRPSALLKFCGVDVWNVHRKNGTVRPPEEWTVVENAHPAIITPEEAQRIFTCRCHPRFDRYNPNKESPHLLTGGLLKCGECGSNMINHPAKHHQYYACGSHFKRQRNQCTLHGVYVPKEWLESEIINCVRARLVRFSSAEGDITVLNTESANILGSTGLNEQESGSQISEIDEQIARIRKAILQGLDDVEWANTQLCELRARREHLLADKGLCGKAPTFSHEIAKTLLGQLDVSISTLDQLNIKQHLRGLLDAVILDPNSLRVELQYAYPGPFSTDDDRASMGYGFQPKEIPCSMKQWFTEEFTIPAKGSRTRKEVTDNIRSLSS